MVLRNPTDSTVTIQLDGVTYSVAPNGVTKNLPDSVASRWAKVHGFLRMEESAPEVKEEEVVVAPEEPVQAENVAEESDRVHEVKESPVAPAAPARGKGLIARLKAASKGKK